MNIYNFTNRKLCEYANIFPTVAALLDHLLFTIGNGYDFDEDTGMIVEGGTEIRIDKFRKMSAAEWKKLIEQCHAKERRWQEEFNGIDGVDEPYLAEKCKVYKIHNVDDSMFTEDALYAQLIESQIKLNNDEFSLSQYHRPYPLSERYSDIFNLNINTPEWFIQIALNFCNAWVRFLTEAIEHKSYSNEESDYDNLLFTIKYRDMIAGQSERLRKLLEK